MPAGSRRAAVQGYECRRSSVTEAWEPPDSIHLDGDRTTRPAVAGRRDESIGIDGRRLEDARLDRDLTRVLVGREHRQQLAGGPIVALRQDDHEIRQHLLDARI